MSANGIGDPCGNGPVSTGVLATGRALPHSLVPFLFRREQKAGWLRQALPGAAHGMSCAGWATLISSAF